MSDQVLKTYPILAGLSKSHADSQSILDVFVSQDIIDYEDAEKLRKNFKTNRQVEDFLVKNRLVTKDNINKAYAILLKMPYISLKNIEIPEEAKRIINKQQAQTYGIIPFSAESQIIKLAISRPSDLWAGYAGGLTKLLESSNLAIELFITGESDFLDAIGQYDEDQKSRLLLKRGSLPVVSLKSMKIARKYLTKIPREYIEKYRIVVFSENIYGAYMIACQEPDSVVTKRVLKYIENENKIKVELFAASKDDFDEILNNFDQYLNEDQVAGQNVDQATTKTEDTMPEEAPSNPDPIPQPEVQQEEPDKKNKGSFSINKLFKSDSKSNNPQITIDSVASDQEQIANDIENMYQDVDAKNGNDKKAEEKKDDPKNVVEIKESNQQEAQEDQKVEQAQPQEPQIRFGGESLETQDLGSLIQGEVETEEELQAIIKEGYVPKIVAAIVKFCLNKKVSDIHIEPQNKTLRVRARQDGILVELTKLPLALHPPIISRVKILSKLKIDETRIPQDGRFAVSFENRDVDVRVSSLPTVHGEKLVLRILDKSQKTLSLEDLGMMGDGFDKTMQAIVKPWGIILSTGPTGSGKSTTLNAIIARLNQPGVNISTLEDPVEYETPGVNQSQVKPEIGFTFANGLRSLLRQDPNIIMVGEIRDGETAAMATHAALTGHLVLSTLHTNDTAGAMPRLINMGIEPFLITSSMDLIIAQRLVRRICPKCKEEMKVPAKLLDDIKKELEKIPEINKKDLARVPAELKFYYGKGCPECNQGYKGRIGLFEVMSITPEIEELAIARRPANEIKIAAIKNGMITMKQDGILKVLAGMTTLDEVFQATMDN